MKKRILCALIALTLIFSLFSLFACNSRSEDNGKLKILCTLFPQYDWLRNITKGSEGVELSLIIANGSDPHSYQPTAEDIMNISNCDIMVYVGGDSDKWVEEAIERSKNTELSQVVLSSLEGVTLRNVSASSHSHSHDHDHSHEHEGHSHSSVDEHLYLSLHNAIASVRSITKILCEKDTANAELYKSNAEAYINELSSLDAGFKKALNEANIAEPFMLFADRFPFVYLLSDYGISYSAAFEGCTTDVDASFDTVLRLIKEADAHSIGYIAVTETSDKALAQTVISSTKAKNQEILTLNSMQSVTKSQIEKGASYILTMAQNLEIVKKAIGIKN